MSLRGDGGVVGAWNWDVELEDDGRGAGEEEVVGDDRFIDNVGRIFCWS